jgi:hypothetical protein
MAGLSAMSSRPRQERRGALANGYFPVRKLNNLSFAYFAALSQFHAAVNLDEALCNRSFRHPPAVAHA